MLSEGELVALYFAEKVLRQYRGTPYEKDVASPFRKLQAQMTEDVVVKPGRSLFDIEKYMADAFHLEKGGRPANVAVRFAPRQARWIRERRWQRSARVQEWLDGGCVLRMRVAVTSELVRWVLQYGPEAEVLAPKRLRREVMDRLSQAIASYEGPPVPPKRGRQDHRAHR